MGPIKLSERQRLLLKEMAIDVGGQLLGLLLALAIFVCIFLFALR